MEMVRTKSIAGTESCLGPHIGYVISGRMGIAMNDVTEQEFDPDEAFVIPLGHDGRWGMSLVLSWTSLEPMCTPMGQGVKAACSNL
jgi:hypothetical protein